MVPAGAEPASSRLRIPRAVWLVTAVHIALLLGYSVLVPALRGPDELFYVDQMRRLAGVDVESQTPLTSDDGRPPPVAPSVLAAAASSPAYTPGAPPVAMTDAVPPDDRPSFADLGEDASGSAPASPAPASLEAVRDLSRPAAPRPPLPTWLGAAVLTGAGAVLPGWPWSFDRTVALLRLVDVAAVATLPVLAWATARRFGCPPRASLTAAVAILAVPQLTHLGSVVGDDALVLALAAVVFLLGARVLTGDRSRRTAVLAGLSCGLAMLASGSALVLVPWMVLAYVLAPRGPSAAAPGRGDPRQRLGRPLIVVGLATLVGGWWHLGHLITDQGVQLGLDRLQSIGPGAGSSLASRLLADAWGAFGWREAVLPTVVVVGTSAALVGAIGVAFARGRVRSVRLRLALLVLPAASLATLSVGAALWSTLSGDAPLRVEGRVVLVGVVGLVVVASVGLDQLRATPTPSLPALVFVAAIGLQGLAMMTIVGRYWAGASLGERLRTLLAFAPWPPVLVFFGIVGALAVTAWAMVEILQAIRPPRSAPPVPTTVPAG